MTQQAVRQAESSRGPAFSYQATLAVSERIGWKVDDLIGGDKGLDFDKSFMPDTLARVRRLGFLTADEQRLLNQIRGHDYLYTFGMVEEFILPWVLDHARPQLHGDPVRVRALLQFAGEEAKHIHLFQRFREEFTRGFGYPCEVIGPPSAVAQGVLAHHPLAVGLVILQTEWVTQAHYLESVKNDDGLDPQFKSLLRHHWMEEAQHAKLDTLMVSELAAMCSPEEIDGAVDGYFAIAALLDEGLMQQVEFDVASFERASGRSLTPAERAELVAVQRQAVRYTYLGSGMQHPRFLATLEQLRPAARTRVEQATPAFC